MSTTTKRCREIFEVSESGEVLNCPGGEFISAGKQGKKGKERFCWKCKACQDRDASFSGTSHAKLQQHYDQYHGENASAVYQSCGEDVSKRPANKNECVLLVSNVAKQHNLGEMVRSLVAFGGTTLYTVGNENKIKTFGNQGTLGFLSRRHCESLKVARDELVARGFSICGVEICEGAKSVVGHPFNGPTAFMSGNEGHGLSPDELAMCDQFVYIPQVRPPSFSTTWPLPMSYQSL